jgi:hypothetical protein
MTAHPERDQLVSMRSLVREDLPVRNSAHHDHTPPGGRRAQRDQTSLIKFGTWSR